MLNEIRELGFDHAELSHGIRISLLPGILDAVDANEIGISTVHNFCPLPIGVNHASPNLFKFSSLERRERENAWRYTIKTFETAERVRARLVVLHLGAIEMKNYTEKLIKLAERELRDTPKYEKLCTEALDKRGSRKEKHTAFAHEILARLAEEAERRGLLLGIENREALEEIPFESDSTLFFREFTQPSICYWHDVGHAQIKDNLGLIIHTMHLGSVSDRLAGFHIHDVEYPARDHRPPGTGTVNFAALRPFVRPEHIKVFEFSPTVTVDELKQGVGYLKDLWGGE